MTSKRFSIPNEMRNNQILMQWVKFQKFQSSHSPISQMHFFVCHKLNHFGKEILIWDQQRKTQHRVKQWLCMLLFDWSNVLQQSDSLCVLEWSYNFIDGTQYTNPIWIVIFWFDEHITIHDHPLHYLIFWEAPKLFPTQIFWFTTQWLYIKHVPKFFCFDLFCMVARGPDQCLYTPNSKRKK